MFIRFVKNNHIQNLIILGKQDVFVCMPTGSGKSLCFQLPAIMKEQKVAIIFSPLLALMKVFFVLGIYYIFLYVRV